MCCSVYCLCVNVYSTTATGCQPNCSTHIYQISNIRRRQQHLVGQATLPSEFMQSCGVQYNCQSTHPIRSTSLKLGQICIPFNGIIII
jgi:hypothetical protein